MARPPVSPFKAARFGGGQAPGRGRIPQPGAAARWPAWRKSLARRRPVSKQRPLAVPGDTARQPAQRAPQSQPSPHLTCPEAFCRRWERAWLVATLLASETCPGRADRHVVLSWALGPESPLRPAPPPPPVSGPSTPHPQSLALAPPPPPVAGPHHTGWPLRPLGPSGPAPPPPAHTASRVLKGVDLPAADTGGCCWDGPVSPEGEVGALPRAQPPPPNGLSQLC